jgi:hypothetical protein
VGNKTRIECIDSTGDPSWYRVVWTLKKGVIHPPRPVDDDTQAAIELSVIAETLQPIKDADRDVFWERTA